MGLRMINRGQETPKDINVIIEIPAHAEPIKYEVDKDTGILFVDRFISTNMRYPCNYGYIPQTLSEDGDPLDVLVVAPMPVNCGCVIRSRPIGVLCMTDEKGVDMKILAVPHDDLTPMYRDINCVKDLPEPLLAQIEHFFTHYKDLEDGKWVKLDGWSDAQAAFDEIDGCIKRYDAEE
jgi:inorganic pyrophosphatase